MKVIDYSNTIMYKLVPNDLNLNLIYIGSTTNFRARKNTHKCYCTNPHGKKYNSKVYSMIRDNGGWNEWQMIEIEKYPCADSNECRKRERELMEQFNANLNTNKPYLSQEEFIQNKNKYNTYYNPIYRSANKELLNAKAREKYHQQKLALKLEN